MKIQNYKHLVLVIHACLGILYPFNSFSQVTIGSATAPLPGAILQLKQNENAGVNSTKGIMLPRVKISTTGSLADISDNPGSLDHIGLMVYSTADNFCGIDFIYKGPYTWSGSEWEYLGEQVQQLPEVGTFVDSRDGVEYRYREFGVAGTWMLDDLRAFVYDGPGTAPILSAATGGPPHMSKQYAYPGPNGDGYNDIYFQKQPAIGILYTWAAAINVEPGVGIDNPGSADEGETGLNSTVVRQGMCPQGWHVPSDKEWNDLESVIAQSPEAYSTNSGTTWDELMRTTQGQRGTHGTSMKNHCQPIAFTDGIPSNGKSFLPDAGGFNILLVGDLYQERVQNFGTQVSFWSSNARDAGAAWNRRFNAEEESVGRYNNDRNRLYSVRCKMD